jgi:Arc/MetJ family transcription regulator
MAKMQIDIGDDLALQLREFTLAKYGKFRGQSLVVEAAIRDYLKSNIEKKDALDGTRA